MLFWLLASVQFVAPGAQRAASGEVTGAGLQRKMDQLVAEIRAAQGDNGAFARGGNSRWPVGQTSLAVLALRAAGVPADDPAIAGGVQYLLRHGAGMARGVYETSLKVMAFEAVDPAAYGDEIAAGARYLIKAQQASGGWSYGGSGRTDNSNSQFAVLGLHSAAKSGARIPDAVWEAARSYFVAGQNADGGWAYRSRAGRSYGSMTAAGVASLYICDLWLHVSGGRCGVYPDDRRVQSGLHWMARNFSVTRNPLSANWKFYYLYGLERAGTILARRYLGRHDWYREGVEHLVGDPEALVYAPSGHEGKFLPKCYVLLFLAKGNAPILVQKAEWAGNWSAHRYDARFLVEYVGRELGQRLDWQVVPLDAPLDQLMAAPILYVSGKDSVGWSRQQTDRLKQYMEAGGFVLVQAVNGEQAFDRAFRGWVQTELPDATLERLPQDHPIYSCYFDVAAADRPPLEAIKGPCWISLLYAPAGLSCPWDVAQYGHVNFRLGTNIAAYVTGLERLEGKLAKPVYYVPPERESEPRRGAFTLGQVVHGGQWQPHKIAWPRVLEMVNLKAGMDVYSRPLPVKVDVETPFQAQMLYLTGVQELDLNLDARNALKLYLERGGFIFAEAACGSRRFDRSFRELMREMFPKQELRELPVGHPLFEFGEPLPRVVYSPAVRRAAPALRRPVLEFIELDERAVIVYSKYDLSSAIDGHPCYSCPSVLEPSASRLVLKIVLYGLSS